MKHLPALLSCAILVATPHMTLAGEVPLPERNPAYQNVSVDQASLAQARRLLEQISIELNKAPSEPAEKYAKVEPAPVVADAPPPKSQPVPSKDLAISYEGDLALSCGALSGEALRMRDMIFDLQDVKDTAQMRSRGVTAAGAVGSFLIGTATGGIGLAAAGFLIDHNISETEEEADSLQDIAEQRRTLVMGIYNAKGCEGPLEHAMQNPDIFDPLSRLANIETASGYTPSDYNH